MSKEHGEGSRGGHVIGHTRSGKPVYENSDHPQNKKLGNLLRLGSAIGHKRAAVAAFPNWSAVDHVDASQLFRNKSNSLATEAKSLKATKGQKRAGQKKENDSMYYGFLAAEHHSMADFHSDPNGPLKKSHGEGSHGGQIIGHTKSGHAIYQQHSPRHPDYHAFGKQDHLDASEAHAKQMSHHLGLSRAYRGQASRDPSLHSSLAGLHESRAMAHRQAARSSLAKSEGTRGGHVIGHTRSGKPIYSTHTTSICSSPFQSPPDYTAHDHLDAGMLHHRLSFEIEAATGGNSASYHHGVASGSHLNEAEHMLGRPLINSDLDAASIKKSAHHGEGSHGGHVIGHTRSGKPIYSLRHDMNQVKGRLALHASHQLIGYERDDHADAAAEHMAAYKQHAAKMPNRANKHLKLAAHHSAIATQKGNQAPKPKMSGLKSSYDTHAGLAAFHLREAEAKRNEDPAEALWHYGQVGLHSDAAEKVRNRDVSYLQEVTMHTAPLNSAIGRLEALAKAEGSRGGHIIGHSKSGRAIYAVKGNKRELLHKLNQGQNHVAVASSLKHGHYIGMTGADHFKRSARHGVKAASHFAKAKKAASVPAALKLQKMGQAHADLGRAHAMMGQLSADVRMPDHIREAAQMQRGMSHDKDKLAVTKGRYFSTLGQAGHERSVSRHSRLRDAAQAAGQQATAEHHDTMAHAHQAVLHSFYGNK